MNKFSELEQGDMIFYKETTRGKSETFKGTFNSTVGEDSCKIMDRSGHWQVLENDKLFELGSRA